MTKRENTWLKAQKQKKFMRQMRFFQDKYGSAMNRINDLVREAKPQIGYWSMIDEVGIPPQLLQKNDVNDTFSASRVS